MTPNEFIAVRVKGSDCTKLTGQEMQEILNAWLHSRYNMTGTTDLLFSRQALVDLMESAETSKKPQEFRRAFG
ncbi:MAG: hypothetical protein N0E58_08930 [Candidatus Thiodiazotropha endolucinida]|uniref:Uncharacterized protein n=1 Tax=Candidatus Thiodiazotropha taylori TaxID=2792791 RepID=A0A9E4NJ32_9GAMM|nr:hypothetical protein [Candidatus Thiodiazotropha taylori]MCW4236377.1 hypothetical protein [Candidatus Thiodiazotropha endolucinida]